jgi:hypothetical protein
VNVDALRLVFVSRPADSQSMKEIALTNSALDNKTAFIGHSDRFVTLHTITISSTIRILSYYSTLHDSPGWSMTCKKKRRVNSK